MKINSQIFAALPDVIIFTDAYWYVLDFNRTGPFEKMRKGKKLTQFMPDCTKMENGEWRLENKIFMRTISPLYEHDLCVGYTIYLIEITEKVCLIEQSREKSRELAALMQMQKQRKDELEQITRQAEALSDYSEQIRIARAIHDGAGHMITTIHAISQMCLDCREKDPAQYHDLLNTGIAICERTEQEQGEWNPHSLKELFEFFQKRKPFPILLSIHGEEPAFATRLYRTIYRVCKEAYHNTLSHSLADALQISLTMEPQALTMHISDNGCFRGAFKKGFGLTNMEKSVLLSGGSISFTALPGKGFSIDISWRADNES